MKPKLTKHDLKRWKEDIFTKFFFEYIENDLEVTKEAIINLTKLCDDQKEIYSAGGVLKTLEKIRDVDCQALGIVEEEDDSKQS